jgi:hypothetical protein
MRIASHILSFLVILPTVLALLFFGFIGLLGAIYLTVISAFSFRPSEYGSIFGTGQILHLVIVAISVTSLVLLIEFFGTDSEYYRPIYKWFIGLPFLFIAPFIQHQGIKKDK